MVQKGVPTFRLAPRYPGTGTMVRIKHGGLVRGTKWGRSGCQLESCYISLPTSHSFRVLRTGSLLLPILDSEKQLKTMLTLPCIILALVKTGIN